MRLVDADALTMLLHDDIDGLDEEFPNDKQVKPYMCGVKMALSFIDTAPTIDPVRHGRWEEYGKTWWCSECGFETGLRWDYCPDCGAIMDEEVKE